MSKNKQIILLSHSWKKKNDAPNFRPEKKYVFQQNSFRNKKLVRYVFERKKKKIWFGSTVGKS